jgi:hypothetical protein
MNYESQINARFPSSKEKYIYATSDNIFSLNPFCLFTLTKLGMHFLLPENVEYRTVLYIYLINRAKSTFAKFVFLGEVTCSL